MKYGKGKLSLFLLTLLSLLFVGKASFAIDDWTLVDECTYMGCDGWDCIRWGEGDDKRFCWCTFCEDYSFSPSIYQDGQDQYLCAVPSKAGISTRCASFPLRLKTVDLNDTQMAGTDKPAIDEIRRLKGLNANQKVQTIAPMEVTTPIQQPTKSTFPFLRRGAPVSR